LGLRLSKMVSVRSTSNHCVLLRFICRITKGSLFDSKSLFARERQLTNSSIFYDDSAILSVCDSSLCICFFV
jgi:hypothetical protein